MKKIFILFLIMMIELSFSQEFYSPSKNFKLSISANSKGEIIYKLSFKGKDIIKESKLGIELVREPNLIDGFEIQKIEQKEIFEKWSPVWGEVDTIVNHCNSVLVYLKQPSTNRYLNIQFRIFDDGLGFRYEFPKQDKLKYFIVAEEHSEFAMTGNHTCFWIPGDYDSQEYTYTTSRFSEINSLKGRNFDDIITKSIPGENFVQTPLMIKTDDKIYINIHEAALIDYPAMYLKVNKQNFVLSTHLCPDAYGNKAYLQTPFHTPWRTLIISDKAEKILESKIILNLTSQQNSKMLVGLNRKNMSVFGGHFMLVKNPGIMLILIMFE